MVDRHPNLATALSSRQAGEHQIWDRLPKEPAKAYAVFCQYRDMRPRNIRALAKALGRRSCRRLEQWSIKWNWVERATAYEEHLDKAWRATKAGEIELVSKQLFLQLKKMRWLVSEETDVRIEKAIREKRAKNRDPDYERQPAVTNMGALARLQKDTITLSRLLIGESTENVTETSAFDPSKLSVEELTELRRLQEKAKKR